MRTVAPSFFARLMAAVAPCIAVAMISLSGFSVRADELTDVQKLLSAGKNIEAIKKADQFLATKPKDPMMRFFRGIGLSQSGRSAEALTVFQKLTEDYPELPEPFNNMAVLYAQQGQYEKSRTALEMAIRTNPSYATAYENLGDVYAKMASQAYSKALQMDTRSAVAPKLAMIRDLFPKDNNSVAMAATATNNKPVTNPVPSTPAPVAPTPTPTPTATTVPVTKPPVAPITQPPSTVATVSNESEKKSVEDALRAWASAWSAKNVNRYIQAYSADFKGNKSSRSAWEEERRDRITSKRKIDVDLSNIDISINGDTAKATFYQSYKADSLDVASSKRIDFIRVNNQWLIKKETSGS